MTTTTKAAATPEIDANVVMRVEGLTCALPTPGGMVKLVDDVSFELRRGAALGIVGESGSGKTMLVRALMGISPKRAVVTGKVFVNGVDLLSLPKKERRRLQGSSIGMVFQNPMTALNPVVPIGRQITEGMRYHQGLDRAKARARAVELLSQVGMPDPESRLSQYPHQLSGGMRQRVTIAAALACDPTVLIADEATTALDVTVQKQILDLLQDLQAMRNMSVITISHDLGVVAGRTHELGVMYSGQMIEKGPTEVVFRRHQHRYTEALLRSVPRLSSEPHTRLATIPGTVRRPSADFVGCRFAARCGEVLDACTEADPPIMVDSGESRHWHRCINPTAKVDPTDAAVLV